MKLRSFILLLLIFTSSVSFARADNKEFESFANYQHILMNTAYQKHDVKAYGALLDKFLVKYKQLSPADQKFYNGFVSQKDAGDKIEMTFLTSQLQGFSRWYMHFGDHADILEPPNLKDIIKSILASISKRLK